MQSNKTDARIQRDVLDELKWDTRVDAAEVGVQVHQGIVTLTGTVSSWAKRIAARDAAHRVAGVHDVADDLVISHTTAGQASDTELAESARAMLKWHAMLPEHRIHTTVSHGVVTLSGTVDFASQRDDAARAVGYLDGVCAVSNEITVVAPAVSPEILRSAIEGALERHVAREARKLQLDIDGGKVVVSGQVDSLAERLAVVGAVWGTRGVETVIDQTRIG